MAKELIVSVNGREKKIAVVEDGRVTEFYIERGEGGQGVVGNIYKGRVMRVLPGMQSAFVDIGLERDAFLYVSDFFDEEEEFERIVVERPKGEDQEAARAAAAERIERARIERERQVESAHEQAQTDGEETDASAEEFMTAVTAAGGTVTAEPSAAAESAPEVEESEESGRRGRRRRRGGRGRDEEPRGVGAQGGEARSAALEPHAPLTSSFAEDVRARLAAREEIETPFATGADSFERVVDEDEAAAGEGELFKDARLQERIFDQIHAVEFDLDDAASAPVGSLLNSEAASTSGSGFERVADDEEVEAPREVRAVQPAVAASVASLAESLDAMADAAASPRSFERVSDDEKAAEIATVAAEGDVVGKAAKKRGAAKKSVTKGAEKSAGRRTKSARANDLLTAVAEEPAPKAAAKKSAAKKSGSKAAPSKGRGARKGSAAAASAEDGDGTETPANAEASLTTRASRGEFARRGGRRRRRGGKPDQQGENGTNGQAEEIGETPEPEVESVAVLDAEPAGQPEEARQQRPQRGEAGREGERNGRRAGRGGQEARSGRENRESREGRGSGRDGRDGHSGREGRSGGRRGAPMITDLLREGQEILVQIAKEPISQKGARITSHIALPGRYLVYMPTIEHVGVSRKIESDSERARLRKLIQNIRATEDVPSGGFIVRTAGVGITEENLRDDARYLVRTWRDVRRDAEKKKAPALVHADLDLVQRILRDQLSEEFTAIRIDSEDEYQQVVEFVNRIQPKLVSRVKLYTRDEPILEAYGVQAEIEKAIKPRVWLRSGGYLVINQTEALVAIDVNTGKFVGRGGSRLEDTITKTNLEAVDEIARQIRLRDLGGIIVLDLIDMEDRRNRNRVMGALQEALREDKSPTKVLSFNDFGLVIMTRKRVKQSLERTLCSPCPYCTGSGLVKSPQTVCYEILEEARRLARSAVEEDVKQTTLRVNPEVARALRSTEGDVLSEIEDYVGPVDLTSDEHVHQEQFDFAFL